MAAKKVLPRKPNPSTPATGRILSSNPNLISGARAPANTQRDIAHGALPTVAPVDVNTWDRQYSSTPEQEARDKVALEYNQRIRALQQAAGGAQRQYEQAADTERNYGEQVDPRLANIYSALGTSLQGNAQQNQQTYGSAIDRIRGFYDQAGQSNAGLNQDILARITADAERLGTGSAVPSATQGLTEDFQRAQMQNNNANAGRSSAIAQLAGGIGVADNNRVGAAAQEGAQQRATLQNQIAATLGNLSRANFDEQGNYRSEQSGLEQDRATAERGELTRIGQERFENSTQARQNALDEFLARSGLNLQEAGHRANTYRDNRDFTYQQDQNRRANLRDDSRWNQEFTRGNYEADRNYDLARDQFGLDTESTRGQLEIQRQELGMRQSQLQAELAQANSPEQRRLVQLELDKLQAEVNALNGVNGSAVKEYPAGSVGMSEFMRDNNLSPEYNSAARTIIEGARQSAMAANPTGYTPDAVDQLNIALEALANTGPIPGVNRQLLRQMLEIHYNGLARPG